MEAELERFDPAKQSGRIAYEHLHRYALSREFVSGRRVLDLACGTGYGTAILGDVAAETTGLDISAAAIRTARKRYGNERVKFVVGDCFDLPFEADTFDVVVANEMIEHVGDHSSLISEIRRVLVDKGLLLVSTPNKPVYNRYKPPNVFHVAEMDLPEFRKLLTDRFKHVRMIGTRMGLLSVGYMIDRDEGRKVDNLDGARIFFAPHGQAEKPQISTGELNLSDPEYLLAVCSDVAPEDPGLSHSVFFDERSDLWLEHEKIMAWASGLHEEDEALREDLKQRSEQFEKARERAAQLEAEQDEKQKQFTALDTARSELIEALKGEREAVQSKSASQLSTISSLLGEINASQVAADDVAIITGLFRTNDSLVTERLKRQQVELQLEQVLENSAAIQSESTQLKAANDKIKAELGDRQWELAEERRLHAEVKVAFAKVELQLEQALENSAAIQSESTQLKAANDKIKAELGDRQWELAEERRLHAEVKVALAKAADDVAREMENAANLTASIESLKAERERLDVELASAAQALSEEQGRVAAHVDENAELAERLKEEATRRTALEKEIEKAQSSASEKIAELEAALRTVEQQHDYIADLEDKLTATDRELTEWLELEMSRSDALEAELSTARRSAEERIVELEENLSQATRELAEMRSSRDELRAALAKERESNQEPESTTSLATAQVKEARRSKGAVSLRTQERLQRAPDTSSKDMSRNAIASLHRRTAASIHEAHELVTGRTFPQPADKPLAWHRRMLGHQRSLPTAIFSAEWIGQQRPELGELTLKLYLANPALHTLSPHPLFDASKYFERYPDVAQSGRSALAHYVLHGWREGRDPHPLFANDWYLSEYPDVAADGGMSPLDHYLRYGWREGRRPNPLFDPRSYLDRYPDVEAAEFEPLSHFIMHGESEQRELAIRGLAKVSPSPVEVGGPLSLMSKMLREPAPPVAAEETPGDDSAMVWPPTPLDDFWPTTTMRELISETHEEPLLGRIWHLMSVMNRWQNRPDDFAQSDDCKTLLARLQERAAASARRETHPPAATVIIPVYNNLLDTLLCLSSLLELEERYDFDVIVADDGSSDATSEIIPRIGGNVLYLRQPENLGFLGNCNTAAMQARGRTIVLLNNDTLVFTGWLDGLLDPIENIANVGFVGSKLLNWDGTLQEAGGIFWRDGSAWNFGRNQNARAPEFNYLKDIDYCSGASIAVPAPIWREVGGFDPIYTPAYCEDSDLAFRLREAGYRTLYSPASEVVHHEGRSHGRDVESGIKAYQIANTERLLERWQSVLERDHYPNAQNVLRARDRSFDKKHILVIDHYVPQWDKDAGSRTIFDFIESLTDAGHAVTFWPDNLWRDPEYTPRLQAMGVEVIFGADFRDRFGQFLNDRRDLYDMVLLSRPHIAANYIDFIERESSARIVYYGHDLHFERMAAERRLSGRPPGDEEVRAMKERELDLCTRSDLVLYPSADEAATVRKLLGDGIDARAIAAYRYAANELVDSREAIMTRGNRDAGLHLLFVGGFAHPPNGDAIIYFCRDVMPLVRTRIPEVHLSIVGSRPSAEIQALEEPGIDVLGFVSDERLLELYREADVAIAPLRYGAGVKGKVIEAMARGIPVVTTSVGSQGIENASEFLFEGETPDELAEQVLSAAEASVARERALRALDYVENNYSTHAMIEILETGFGPS